MCVRMCVCVSPACALFCLTELISLRPLSSKAPPLPPLPLSLLCDLWCPEVGGRGGRGFVGVRGDHWKGGVTPVAAVQASDSCNGSNDSGGGSSQ